jgi:hypothetical protein
MKEETFALISNALQKGEVLSYSHLSSPTKTN